MPLTPPRSALADESGPIGQATMGADGTLVMDLRAEEGGGLLGDARLVYPPSHPEYHAMLRHLGGLTPGESKGVPPFP